MHQFDSGRGLLEMKKTALTIIFVLIFLSLPSLIKAQVFDAAKAYSDYQYQLSIYQQEYSDFQDSKTFYLENPTLQLKESVRQKTLKMLKDRDLLMSVYLTAVRMQIHDSTGFDDSQKNAIFEKIDTEIAWYKSHITNYLDSDELTNLFGKSDESKSRYETNTTPIIDESLFDIGLSQEIGIRLSHQQIYSDLKNYINDQVAAGKLKIDPFNRWLNDTDLVLRDLQTNETSAATKIQTLYSQNYGLNATYTDATQILTSSINLLSQLNNYLTEMLTSIENQMK
jgi:hypothetical protein